MCIFSKRICNCAHINASLASHGNKATAAGAPFARLHRTQEKRLGRFTQRPLREIPTLTLEAA